MKILSPPGLHYPITVGDLATKSGDGVRRSAPLFTYFYETTVEEGDKWGEVKEVQKRFPAQFEASVDGTITEWFVKKGTVVQHPGVALVAIEEPCTHETQFGGLCVDCGKDMTEIDYLTKEVNSDRATVNMTHDNIALLVSQKEAVRAEEDSKKRLLSARKLSLIVDLDQTVIHTTCERTIAEWQADPDNPNYQAVKDVKSFQLADDNLANVAANWYYVKMRPGLENFFEQMSKFYEMHIYTMATRAYAQAVAQIIDPERKYFGDRILSRDENYTDKLKSLHRLFPNNTDMAVIIDDRADIWGYSDNLIRVPVFNFFPGAGDINASFLPKQQELVTQSSKGKTAEPATKQEAGTQGDTGSTLSVAADSAEVVPMKPANGALSDLEQQLISMGAGESVEVLQQQVKEQKKVIISQQTERPLLQQQLVLDKEDEEAGDISIVEPAEDGDPQSSDHHKHRHSLLHDDDRGLEVIGANLRLIHKVFYDEYTRKKLPHTGRVAELKGASPKKRPLDNTVPNVGEIMPRIKRYTLADCVFVFSGIIPLGVDVENSDFALWAKSFGAEISLNVNKRTTHLIANPDRKTTKVKKAARYPHIKIVSAEWMFQCCTQWKYVEEAPYSIELDPGDRGGSSFEEGLEDDSVDVTGDENGGEPANSALQLDIADDQWKSMGDELQDFLNESDDTEDASASESEKSVRTSANRSDVKTSRRKRKWEIESDGSEADDSDTSVNSASKLQKRKRRTMERVTSLTNVVNADKSSGLPSPETTGPEEEQGDGDGKMFDPQGQGADLDSDYDDGLAAEMMAELEKSGSED